MDVNTITTSDVALHHKKRRFLNLVFTEKSVRAAGVFIQKHVDLWDSLLPDGDGKDWSTPKNMAGSYVYECFLLSGNRGLSRETCRGSKRIACS